MASGLAPALGAATSKCVSDAGRRRRADLLHDSPPAAFRACRLPQAAPLTKHKVVFLGDQGTGKTTMIKAFMYGTFEQTYKVRLGFAAVPAAAQSSRSGVRCNPPPCVNPPQATVGIDFFSKTLYLDDRTVRLQIWDSAGQEYVGPPRLAVRDTRATYVSLCHPSTGASAASRRATSATRPSPSSCTTLQVRRLPRALRCFS